MSGIKIEVSSVKQTAVNGRFGWITQTVGGCCMIELRIKESYLDPKQTVFSAQYSKGVLLEAQSKNSSIELAKCYLLNASSNGRGVNSYPNVAGNFVVGAINGHGIVISDRIRARSRYIVGPSIEEEEDETENVVHFANQFPLPLKEVHNGTKFLKDKLTG